MGFSYLNMWGLLILLALGAVGGALYRGDLIQSFRDAYPTEVAKQDALRRCQQANPSFSKFSVEDRNVTK